MNTFLSFVGYVVGVATITWILGFIIGQILKLIVKEAIREVLEQGNPWTLSRDGEETKFKFTIK